MANKGQCTNEEKIARFGILGQLRLKEYESLKQSTPCLKSCITKRYELAVTSKVNTWYAYPVTRYVETIV